MQLYIGKNNQETLKKVREKDLKEDLALIVSLHEKYVGDLEINFHHIVKEKDDKGNVVRKRQLIYGKKFEMESRNYIHHIPQEILKSLKVGEEYLFSVITDEEIGEYQFVVEKRNLLLLLIPILLGIIAILGALLLAPSGADIKNPIETFRDIDGDVQSGAPIYEGMSEKEILLNNIQSYSRFVVSSAINVGKNNKCSFEISNPKRTTFQSNYSLEEINRILEGELKVYETARENVYEFDSINIIQVSLQDEEGTEFYCSPALKPDTYIDTIELTKEIPEGVNSIYAVLKTYNPKGEYLNSFQFTIQVNR